MPQKRFFYSPPLLLKKKSFGGVGWGVFIIFFSLPRPLSQKKAVLTGILRHFSFVAAADDIFMEGGGGGGGGGGGEKNGLKGGRSVWFQNLWIRGGREGDQSTAPSNKESDS